MIEMHMHWIKQLFLRDMRFPEETKKFSNKQVQEK